MSQAYRLSFALALATVSFAQTTPTIQAPKPKSAAAAASSVKPNGPPGRSSANALVAICSVRKTACWPVPPIPTNIFPGSQNTDENTPQNTDKKTAKNQSANKEDCGGLLPELVPSNTAALAAQLNTVQRMTVNADTTSPE
jgi:hypothetical protein